MVTMARGMFGLELPATMDELKSAFRKQAKLLHTDVSGADTKKQFVEMKDFYDLLLKFPGAFKQDSGSKELETREGIPLSELGLGLGPMVNGKDCPRCEHRGYTEEYGMTFKLCNKCAYDGMVAKIYPCRPCSGTGKFTQARTGRIVDCRGCKGSGKFEHPHHRVACPDCNGTKTLFARKEEVYYLRCYQCNGTGELKVWNPVLPKGRLG